MTLELYEQFRCALIFIGSSEAAKGTRAPTPKLRYVLSKYCALDFKISKAQLAVSQASAEELAAGAMTKV